MNSPDPSEAEYAALDVCPDGIIFKDEPYSERETPIKDPILLAEETAHEEKRQEEPAVESDAGEGMLAKITKRAGIFECKCTYFLFGTLHI